jgi:molecular chaperone Hsp33
VQCILKGAGGLGSLIADSHPSGKTRGLVQCHKGQDSVELGQGAALRMMRTLPNGKLHQGVVAVPDAGGVSEALMTYMQASEQVATVIAVCTLLDETGAVSASGGYMVQLLPEVGRGPLMVMTERLQDFSSLGSLLAEPEFSPRSLMEELLYGMPYSELTEDAVRFGCWCSEVRVISSLATLPRADIDELVSAGEVLEISCDYCAKEYAVMPAKLRGMLEES